MSLIRALFLDKMRLGDYDNVPVNSTRQIESKRLTFRSALAPESSAYRADYPTPSLSNKE